jgi:hypothetical protein
LRFGDGIAHESTAFRTLSEDIAVLDDRVGKAAAELRRRRYENPAVQAVLGGLGAASDAAFPGGPDARSASEAWSRNTAQALRRDLSGGESRAVISGSVDVPALVLLQVVDIARPHAALSFSQHRGAARSPGTVVVFGT